MFVKLRSVFKRKKDYKIQPEKIPQLKPQEKKLKRKLFGEDQQLSHLQQFEIQDKNSKFNKKFVVSDDFNGITHNRVVTDKYFIHLSVFILVVFLSRTIMIFIQSDQNKIAFPQDYRAQECGINHLQSKKYLYYILPNIHLELKMCVDQCPDSTNKIICLYREDGILEHTEDRFCYSTIQSRKMGKICIPVETKTRKSVLDLQNKQRNFIRNLLGDVIHIFYPIIICFIAISLLQNLISFLVQIPKVSFYINLVIFILGIFGLSSCWLYFYFDYKEYVKKFCYNQIVSSFCLSFKGKFLYYSCIIAICLISFYILYILYNLGKIIISFKFIKTLEKIFLKTRTLISFYSFIQIFLVLFSAFYLNFVSAWFSQGKAQKINIDHVDGGKVKIYNFYDYNYTLLAFDIFLLLLVANLIINFNRVITIFSVTDWYFTRKKMATHFKLAKLLKVFFRYHFGTFLKFTLIKHFFSPLKIFVETLIVLLKFLNNDLDIVRFFISLLFPLLIFYQKFLKFIDYGLFVHVLLWGNNYKKSSIKNYFLQLRNKDYQTQHIYWLKVVGKVQFLGSCFLVCSLLYFLITFVGTEEGSYFQNLDQLFSVILFTFIFSQFLNSGFYDNFFYMQQTIMLCFRLDTEMFYGEQLYYENLFDNFALKYQNYSHQIASDYSIFGIKYKKNKNQKHSIQIRAIDNQDLAENNQSNSSQSNSSEIIKESKSEKSSLKEEESFKMENQLKIQEKSLAQHSNQKLENFDEISKKQKFQIKF